MDRAARRFSPHALPYNPSTLAMELSIPIGGYAGRAGNGLPVSFDYSSKVWQIKAQQSWEGQNGVVTDTRPRYAERSVGGWTSSLGSPRIDYQSDIYDGAAGSGSVHADVVTIYPTSQPPTPLYSVKRLHVVMPDGSTHELRQNDTVNFCGDTSTGCMTDLTGTYLSVDGSKMRLEYSDATSTLYMPDGGRYFFVGGGEVAYTFIDHNGNRMNYDEPNRRWTDTLGRIINDPLAIPLDGTQNQTVGDATSSFPGIGGGATMNVVFSWRYLKDPNGGESGLDNATQSLSYTSNKACSGNSSTARSPYLFGNPDSTVTRVCAQSAVFNPIVLTKITLPNGQSYQLKYNLYGEIEKIIYPTGAYERFLYSYVAPVQPSSDGSYDQANRGVTDRWVSPSGDGTDEIHWSYQAVSQYQQPYKVVTTAPDGIKTEQYLLGDSLGGTSPYGFGDVKTGRSYEDRVLSSTGALLRRHLTGYEWTGAQSGGYAGATRDLRPNKEVNITFEPGSSYALAQMSETVYDTAGISDPSYFSSLNPKQTKTYHYAVLDLTTAQSSTIDQITAYFGNSNLANTSEIDYLYDANYKARNLVSLPVAARIKDAAGSVKAQSGIAYDEGSYPVIYAGAASQWQDPQTGYRGNVTTTTSWTNVAGNQYVQTHAQYDNFGNLRNIWDGRGNVTTTDYSLAYAFAYPTSVTTPAADPSGGSGSSTGLTSSIVYDFTTGLPTGSTDANGQTSSIEYNDPLLRPTKTIAPNGQQTITEVRCGNERGNQIYQSQNTD